MIVLMYDGTYAGWLTAVFEVYEYKMKDVKFVKNDYNVSALFCSIHHVITNEKKAKRVLNGLHERLSGNGVNRLYKSFLSEIENIENIMWEFIKYVFSSKDNIEENLINTSVFNVRKISRAVDVEIHRMHAFVRFQLTKDGLFFALIEPEFNILSLIEEHFRKRYADQRWLIFDGKRKYGIYYDLEKTEAVQLEFHSTANSDKTIEIFDEREDVFQMLWKKYFQSVNIRERKNLKLQMQHMPKKYWRHLTEKSIDL